MGTINHNAVIATTSNDDLFIQAVDWIDQHERKDLFLAQCDEVTNSYRTIVLVPDGSKEFWSESDKGDEIRNEFIEFLESFKYEDGSNSWSYVEVGFGEYGQKVLRGNNVNCFNDREYAEKNPTEEK